MSSRLVLSIVALAAPTGACSSEHLDAHASRSTAPPRPSATAFVVVGVTVELCDACVRAARDARIDLEEVIGGALRRAASLLPDVVTRVSVDVDPGGAIPGIGVGGYTDPTSGTVSISLDLSVVRLDRTLRVWLPQELAHELDHTARIQVGPGYGSSLLEAMTSEGMADAFSIQCFPETPRIPWDHALTKEQERAAWADARRRLGEFDDHAEWFFGSGDLPRWAGYTLGFDIVSGYLRRHPALSAADLVTTDAETILRGSGFPR